MSYKNIKNGDIFKWSYNQETLEESTLELSCGTLYWCASRFAIYDNGVLKDTFWGEGSNSITFGKNAIKEKLDLEFLGNLDDLVQIRDEQRHYYKAADVVNLNHPNSRRGNVYIKKDAQKDLEKMKAIVKHSLRENIKQINYLVEEAARKSSRLDSLTVEDYIDIPSNLPYEIETM